MSNNRRQAGKSNAVAAKEGVAISAAPTKSQEKSGTRGRDFSWYGGQVDEKVIREIVRLKREQKL